MFRCSKIIIIDRTVNSNFFIHFFFFWGSMFIFVHEYHHDEIISVTYLCVHRIVEIFQLENRFDFSIHIDETIQNRVWEICKLVNKCNSVQFVFEFVLHLIVSKNGIDLWFFGSQQFRVFFFFCFGPLGGLLWWWWWPFLFGGGVEIWSNIELNLWKLQWFPIHHWDIFAYFLFSFFFALPAFDSIELKHISECKNK